MELGCSASGARRPARSGAGRSPVERARAGRPHGGCPARFHTASLSPRHGRRGGCGGGRGEGCDRRCGRGVHDGCRETRPRRSRAAVVLTVVFAWRSPGTLRVALLPWPLVVFASGLFLAVGVLEAWGLPAVLSAATGSGETLPELWRLAGIGALAANAVNNLPAYLALEPVADSPVRLRRPAHRGRRRAARDAVGVARDAALAPTASRGRRRGAVGSLRSRGPRRGAPDRRRRGRAPRPPVRTRPRPAALRGAWSPRGRLTG